MRQQLPSWVVVLVLSAVIAGIVAYALNTTSVKRGVGKPPSPPPPGMQVGPGAGGGSGTPTPADAGGESEAPSDSKPADPAQK